MYTPAPYLEDRLDVILGFVGQCPAAVLVSYGARGLQATHLPVVFHPDEGTMGVIRCHLARANPHWRDLQPQAPVLLIFQGPQHYISPSWYPSKEEHGKVVPTLNYVAVHVRGTASLVESQDRLLGHLKALTEQNEKRFEPPWSVDDAPASYIEGLTKAIVGVEIVITQIAGKWKASQNRSGAERQGVVDGLTALSTPGSLEMADLVRERGLTEEQRTLCAPTFQRSNPGPRMDSRSKS